MLFRPDLTDLRVIGLNIGRALTGVGAVMLVPAAFGAALREWNEALAFVIGAGLALSLGLSAQIWLRTRRAATWQHGMVIAALTWLTMPVVAAFPLHLSGHYSAFLDAYFEAMSGFATIGLTLVNDLDHLSASMNLWRHLMQFVGGQGLVLLMLSLFAAGGGASGMYAGEAREDHLVPNIVRTTRIIWRISLVYALLGISALTIALLIAGVTPTTALFHAATLFMAAFDTGGFAPSSASIWLYHSPVVDGVAGVLMIAGGMSFALHYRLTQGRAMELLRNIETRLYALAILALFGVAAVGLVRVDAYSSVEGVVRRGLFHMVSALSTTGFNNVPNRLYVTDWGVLAPAAMTLAIALGPMAGSTGGGIKLIRVGVLAKTVAHEVRRLALPASAVTLTTYHSGSRQVLRDNVVRAALTVLLLYVATYLAGAGIALLYGYPLDIALFESTSATSSAGLSMGITGPTMPVGLKITYILQMWLGRLEFVAVLAFVGFTVSAFRGRV